MHVLQVTFVPLDAYQLQMSEPSYMSPKFKNRLSWFCACPVQPNIKIDEGRDGLLNPTFF